MQLTYDLLLVLHILSWAIVIGGWLTHLRDPRVAPGIFHGAAGALVTGIAMTGIASASDTVDDVDNTKIGVKLVVALACTACAEIANGRQRRALAAADGDGGGASGDTTTAVLPATGLVQATALLAILNVCVAVLWT